MKRYLLCIWLVLAGFYVSVAGNANKKDSLIVNGYVKEAKENWSNVAKLKEMAASTMTLSMLKDYRSGMGYAYKMLGRAAFLEGDYRKGIEKFRKAKEEFEMDTVPAEVAASIRGMSSCYFKLTNLSEAMALILEALKIDEGLNEYEGLGGDWNLMGNLHKMLGNTGKAIHAFKRSIEFCRKGDNERGVAIASCNLASCYLEIATENKDEKLFDLALDYFNYYLQVCKRVRDYSGEAVAYQSIGNTHFSKNKALGLKIDFEKVMGYYLKSLSVAEDTKFSSGIIAALSSIADLNYQMGKFSEAVKYHTRVVEYAKNTGQKDVQEKAYLELSKLYGETNNFRNAYEYHKLYTAVHDALYNEQSIRQMNEMNTRYETERKDKELVKKDKELIKEQAESKQKSIQRNGFVVGLLVVLVFMFFVFRGYQEKKKVNVEITQQRDIIRDKNKEILDSINYAKSIQAAILPSQAGMKEALPDSFVLYKPKDIVSGDFYWLERAGDLVFIAAADCTGHGVPGALVSVVCSNALNRSVKEFGLTDPGKILDKTRVLVLETFDKSEKEVKDGMDISLCCINLPAGTLTWAGANNPLWIIRNNEFIEFKPDKQSVGYHPRPRSFGTRSLELMKGDTLYLFTDGYADQFGGTKGKKYKYRQLQETLLANVQNNMKEQGEKLNRGIETWKGRLDQVDDILMIGIRI